MRILIHAVGLNRSGGSSRHLEEFFGSLKSVGSEHEFLVCLDERFAATYDGPLPRGDVVPVRADTLWRRLWWDAVELNRLVQAEGCDVILALLSFGSLQPPVPQIAFQRTPIYFSEPYLRSLKTPARLITLLRRYWLKRVMQASTLLVTPTQAMRDSILATCPDLPATRFRVIPHPFDQARFQSILSQAGPKRRTNGDGKRLDILYVSQLLPYKGFDLIPKVARHLLDLGLRPRLRFTGGREDWPEGYDRLLAEARDLGVEDNIEPLGRLPLEQAYRLYTEADVFFFPSVCESFGFPMVEAMGACLPIVAADTPVNREMCGPAAFYFRPGDAKEAAETTAGLVDHQLRQNLSQESRRQFPRWATCPSTYVRKVLEVVAEAGRQ